jgi:O-antigen/teichoic acid export membrane protein
LNKYNKKKNNFLLHVITLVSGSAISQGILLTATPFLTRLYTPEEFGIFAFYLAVVGIISVVASWKYELAIMLPKEESDAQALLFLSVIIAFITSIFVFIIIFIFKDFIIKQIANFNLFMWLVPVGVLITGLLQVFTAWGTRKEYYNIVSSTRVVQSGTTIIGQFSLKFANSASLGLIWGNIIGTTVSLFIIIILSIKKQAIHLRNIHKKQIMNNMKKYSKFPKFQSFSVLINSLSQNLPILLLTYFYQPEIAGFYSLTHRALNTPVRLIGGSVRQVYFQRAAKIFGNRQSIKTIFLKSTLGLAKISIVPYVILIVFAPTIFTFVFGEAWLIAGFYAQLLVLFIFTLTINPPAVMSIQILGMQKFHLNYEILLAFCRFFSIYIGFQFFSNHYVSVGLFALVGMLFNMFLIIFIYRKVKNTDYSIVK